MASIDIQAKIKAGLAKAVNKTGSASSPKVYLVSETVIGGDTPLDDPTIVSNDILLKDAIFKSYDQNLVGGNINQGDRQLVSNNDVPISTGDTIKAGDDIYAVHDVETKSPAGDALVYISQVRLQ